MRSPYGELNEAWVRLPIQWRVVGLLAGGFLGNQLGTALHINPTSGRVLELLAYVAVVCTVIVFSIALVILIRRKAVSL